jgi:hypothetical protein
MLRSQIGDSGLWEEFDDIIEQIARNLDEDETRVNYASRRHVLQHRTNLGLALWTLADRDPETGAMDEAIGLLRAVLDGTPPGHAERARFAANLSNAFWARYRRGGRPEDLSDDTIDASEADLTFLGHGYYAEARPVLTDMHNILRGQHRPETRFGLQKAEDPAGRPYWRFRP